MLNIYPISYEIKRDNRVIELDIYIAYKKRVPGVYNTLPENCYPDEPESIEIDNIYYAKTNEKWQEFLTDKEYFEVISLAKDDVQKSLAV